VSSQFDRFERLVERLVEGSLSRLFAGKLHTREIVIRLARAIEDHAQGSRAPDLYRIYLNPQDMDSLLGKEASLVDLLSRQITQLAQMAELDLPCVPKVELLTRPEIASQTVEVSAAVTEGRAGQTQGLDPSQLRRASSMGPDGGTYLIIDGRRHVPLTRTVYTIGRRLDCDVVLSDSTVSRRHAQLRWRFGRYVLYDLGSSAGTLVNGHPITEVVLEPGDVLSLGSIDIIYGRDRQGDTGPREGGSTQSFGRDRIPGGNL
jgi:hypothetical protein